ncbi:hypothetical protein [Bradyrhizobium sp. SZCCHNS1054]|uniref:hypothetical protein n=1 Tax=Bradyrhizobium sp. SZCCHNS1054 TaxID=3057301 RepID=UPI002916FBB7|nr:hypothetical protein [Bradyrhizobium sp. SZCCHNS1054]
MADPMTAFRRVRVEGPAAGSDGALWQAWLDLGYQAGAPAGNAELRSHSIRVLLQREQSRRVPIQGKADVFFEEPMLLAAAVTTVDFRNSPTSAPYIKIGKAQFTPFALEQDDATPRKYSELRLAPRSGWPSTSAGFTPTGNIFELTAPLFRATRGRIRVGCARDAEPSKAGDTRYPLTRLLAIDWNGPGYTDTQGRSYVRIFGGFLIRKRKTANPIPGHPAVSDAIAFDLTPDGIEFDVIAPNPFSFSTTDPIDPAAGLQLRLRLAPCDNGDGLAGLQLELIDQYPPPAGPEPFAVLNAGLASISHNLAENGGFLLLQVDTDTVPPLAWPLKISGPPASPVWSCENPNAIPPASFIASVRILEKSVTARLLTREDFDGGDPGVAEFSRHVTALSPRRPADGYTLTILSQAKGFDPGVSDPTSPDVTLSWSDDKHINPDKISITGFSGMVEIDPLADQLGAVWSQSGAIPAGTRPPYAFVALERGWAQLPLAPARTSDQDPVSLVAADSAFRGYLRLAIDNDNALLEALTDQPTLPGLEIVTAQQIKVTVSWSKPDVNQSRSAVARLSRAAGTLDGALWTGQASPTPTDVLPPLDAGPAALGSVPISFGVTDKPKRNWHVDVAAFDQEGPKQISVQLPLFGSVVDPLLVWQPHSTLALVSSVSMTRTADDALRPSATRELVPAEILQGPLVFTFAPKSATALQARLPSVQMPSTDSPSNTVRGDGRWHWPWPSTVAAGAGPYASSPVEAAGVALASLTLPGVEFIPGGNAPPVNADSPICFSLRFDLPILDELFANAKAPQTTIASAQAAQSVAQTDATAAAGDAPTALDMIGLSAVWSENARRLARARTEADRVVLKKGADGKVQLWHPLSGVPGGGGIVLGLVEPYVWTPAAFSFAMIPPGVTPSVTINLGAYRLGDTNAWYYGPDALGGLVDTAFALNATQLTPGSGDIKVNGFAASSFNMDIPSASDPTVKVMHLHDARGLLLALAPDKTSGWRYTSRTIDLRIVHDDQTIEDQMLVLATACAPVPVKIGDRNCNFWFRDLPLKQNTPTTNDPGVLVFDASGGLETGLGPDPTAINRIRLARTLYEWSFYESPESAAAGGGTSPLAIVGRAVGSAAQEPPCGRFEFDLAGPLTARPLRLRRAGFDASGDLLTLEIVVSVQFKGPSQAGDAAPFAADAIYATGNLATMTFERGAGGLALTHFDRCELRDPSDPQAATDPFEPSGEPISLVAVATVRHGPRQSPSLLQSQTQLSFNFKPGIKVNAPDITMADLRVRLFGQDCDLNTTDAGFTADGRLTATFKAPAFANDILKLRTIALSWASDANGAGVPNLYLEDGTIDIPLRTGDKTPLVFRRDFAKATLQWLGFAFPIVGANDTNANDPNRLYDPNSQVETIDHDLGVVTIKVLDAQVDATGQSAPSLFRGFLLPNGQIRGTIVVVFKTAYASDDPKSWSSWPQPKPGSAFVEFAFDADATAGGPLSLPQRVSAIRHRHSGEVSSGSLAWGSRMMLDAGFAAPDLHTSSVTWPVGRASLVTPFGSDPASILFNPDAAKPNDWKATLQIAGTSDKLVLSHSVQPRICAHQFPARLLGLDGTDIILQSPWTFRAVVDHSLKPARGTWPLPQGAADPGELKWTSIDELTLFDMKQLMASAVLKPDPARDRYAFLARYKDQSPEADFRIAGVARRALADAGFPVEYVMQALASTSAPKPESLVLTGAGVTEVVTTQAKPDLGVPLVMQWILPWAPLQNDPGGVNALGALAHCPQADDSTDRSYKISLYDAAAGAPRPLDGSPVRSFSAQDGTQSVIDARMSGMVGGGARSMVAVDQAILEPSGASVDDRLKRPLFPRTLLALSAVARAFGAAGNSTTPFSSRISCVTVIDGTPLDVNGLPSGDGRRHADEIRFVVSAWPPGSTPTETPAPAVTLIVADDTAINANRLPATMAAALVDPSSNEVVAEGQDRADAAMRALVLSARPRAVILASVDTSYLSIHEAGKESLTTPRPLPHVSWLIAAGDQPALTMRRPHVLRKLPDTVYASPALGWPSIPRGRDASRAHAGLGQEEVRRNKLAWAGRVRNAAWSAIAWDRSDPGRLDSHGMTIEGGYDPADAAETRESAFISAGQRVALRRAAAKNLRSAPDRLSTLAPPRARAPTVDAVSAALKQARNPLPPSSKDRSGLAPMLPGAVEFTVTGQRPGVMLTQFEGVTLTSSMVPFDPEFNRFGRPAWRAPLTVHQVRAPRSSELPKTNDLTVRRRTFLAADEIDGDDLKPFKIVKGPAQVVRFYRTSHADMRSPHAVTLALRDPDGGRLAANWDGKIRLLVTVPMGTNPDPAVLIALTRAGLWPRDGNKLRAELLVGNLLVVFTKMTCVDDKGTGPPSNPARLILEFAIDGSGSDAARTAVSRALHDVTADTPIRFTMRGVTPMQPADDDPVPSVGPVDLATTAVNELLPGPPPVVVFDLPHIPTRQRWLDVETFTLAFGDPAYDRELGSPARNTLLAINDVPHVLAVDRAEYDPSAKIYLAFWMRKKDPADSPAEPPAGTWSLRLQVVPGDGGPMRKLRIAATLASPGSAADDPRYVVAGHSAYAIALSSLQELPDPKNPAAEKAVQFTAGDRLQIGVSNDAAPDQQLVLGVGIIAQPVLPPPASTYGLATLQSRLSTAVGTSLFATAPLPQAIEFPDLLGDLVLGHVRRRGLFLWPFATNIAPRGDGPNFGYLVKVDRTGGGQLPRQQSDFTKCEA